MPVHFNFFIADKEEDLRKKLFSDIVTKYTEKADNVFVNDDKTKIHMTTFFKNIHTKKEIGKVVITLIVRPDNIELVDTDIVLLSNHKTKLHFEEKLEESSEANEYYMVYDLEQEKHFDIETVNRYTIPEDIENKDIDVYLSAFPFQLDVFENEDEMNRTLGLGKEVDIPAVGKKVITMDPRMMSDGRVMTDAKEPCSFIIGKVTDFKDVEVDIANNNIKFKMIDLDTAIGNMPVAVHGENFDLSKLKKGALVGMVADIKADLSE